MNQDQELSCQNQIPEQTPVMNIPDKAKAL